MEIPPIIRDRDGEPIVFIPSTKEVVGETLASLTEHWCYGREFYPLQGTTHELIPFSSE